MGSRKKIFSLKNITFAAALFSFSVLLPEASAENQSHEVGKSSETIKKNLKSMVRVMRYTADMVYAKAAVSGHVNPNGYFCPKGEGAICNDNEKIKMRCGFPDATPDGIIRAMDFNIGLKEEDKPDPDTPWVYVYKEWNKDATQILVTKKGLPVPDAFQSEDEWTYKNQCYIFYNTPCFQDPNYSKFDGNVNGVQFRVFTDGC